MRTSATLLLVSLTLVGCSGEKPPVATTAIATSPTATQAPEPVATTPNATQPTAAQAAEIAEEKRVLNQAWAQSQANNVEEAARVKQAVAELSEAASLLGADPIPTIRGRIETCFSGDKLAFASFYAPEMAASLSGNSKILDFEYHHECGLSAPNQPRPDIDALIRKLKVYAKRSDRSDRVTGDPIYKLCRSDTGPEFCVLNGAPWHDSVEVRNGRVVFVMD